MPDVRLIMTIRNPVDRAWSGARRILSKVADQAGTTIEELPDREFYEFFRKEWAYRPERHPPGVYQRGMLQGQYSVAIERWLRYFREDQLLLLTFDDIKQNPYGTMEKFCEHIGVSTDLDWDSMPLRKVVNKNPTMSIPPRFRHYLEDLYADELIRLKERYGLSFGYRDA